MSQNPEKPLEAASASAAREAVSREVRAPRYARIQFATTTVKPEGTPPFTYVASEVYFDCVLFTAVLEVQSEESVAQFLARYWPQAQLRVVELDCNEFRSSDTMARHPRYFGMMSRSTPGFFRRVWDAMTA